jgi:hypothetical protein
MRGEDTEGFRLEGDERIRGSTNRGDWEGMFKVKRVDGIAGEARR